MKGKLFLIFTVQYKNEQWLFFVKLLHILYSVHIVQHLRHKKFGYVAFRFLAMIQNYLRDYVNLKLRLRN